MFYTSLLACHGGLCLLLYTLFSCLPFFKLACEVSGFRESPLFMCVRASAVHLWVVSCIATVRRDLKRFSLTLSWLSVYASVCIDTSLARRQAPCIIVLRAHYWGRQCFVVTFGCCKALSVVSVGIPNRSALPHVQINHFFIEWLDGAGHWQVGSLAGVAHLLKCNTGVLRAAP